MMGLPLQTKIRLNQQNIACKPLQQNILTIQPSLCRWCVQTYLLTNLAYRTT